jgi:choice-of-anchor B domain-containing protein
MTRISAPLAALITMTLAATPAVAQVSRNVTLLAHLDDYASYSAGCAYVHTDGREYAFIGTNTGTAIYRVTVPTAPALVGFIPGPNSIWREMKPYGDHVYIVSEGSGAGAGLQIVRMTNPDAPVLAATWTGQFTTAHTVTIDKDRAILWANGGNGSAGGMHALSLANPEAPTWLGAYYVHYAHDSHASGNRLFVASIYEGYEIVLDVTNPAAITEIVKWQTPGKFTHNSWLSDDGNHLFTTDENETGYLTVYDVSALPAVTEVAKFTANPNAIVHNVRVKGDTAWVSYYTEGVRLLDVSDPETPVEFGYYDTWTGVSGGFHGNWDVDPFFPSGIFMVTDIESGLWLFRADPQYGIVHGTVTESGVGTPLSGVTATLDGSNPARTFETYASGRYAFAVDAGSWSFDFDKFGFFPATGPATVGVGQSVALNRALVRRPAGIVNGTMTSGVAATPVVDVRLHLHDTPLATVSGAGGAYQFPSVPEDTWQLEAHRPGYQSNGRVVTVTGGNTTTANLHLPALDYYDNAEVANGWTLFTTGDNASTSGRWVRADPVGTGPQTAPATVPLRDVFQARHHPEYEEGPTSGQPEDDSTPAPGTMCYITGNGVPGGSTGAADVDNGKTTLTTPTFSLVGRTDPHITFYYWFVNDVGANAGEDPFDIAISTNGGASWTPVASILRANHAWEPYDFRVLDYVALSASMKVRFVAQDLGGGSLVEAGIDDFGWYEPVPQSGIPDASGVPAPAGALTAGLNPFLVATDLHLAMAAPGPLDVRVFDPAGRLVRTLHAGPAPADWTVRWDGHDDAGAAVPPGVYFVRATGKDFERSARVVRLR